MRIGGEIKKTCDNPEQWLALARELEYSCVLAPAISSPENLEEIKAYRNAAKQNDIVIGEVGIWKNTLSPDETERKAAIDYAIERLYLAEQLGANCCVNVAGARGPNFAGLYQDNYSKDTYALLIDTTRAIIDAVKPENTFFCLEPMPWMTPDSPDDYLELIKKIDRPAFGVHLDFVNMINTPRKFAFHQDFIKSCFRQLGPLTKSIHLKDIRQVEGVPYSFAVEECPPGEGIIDFKPILALCDSIGYDTTVFVEHLETHEDYKRVVRHIRALAREADVEIK